MKVCILGWYGTETMGDRAILDGIIKLFSKIYDTCHISIGSLYPFFTEHTLLEDKENYLNGCHNVHLSIFDEKCEKELTENIKNSDFVIMGGGPIMDLNELYIIKKGFQIAHQYNIKTGLCGCGIGPLKNKSFIRVTKQILKDTDIGIFRDNFSKKLAEKYCPEKTFYYLPDPAIISILFYRENRKDEINQNHNIVINFRKHPSEYQNIKENVEDLLIKLTEKISSSFELVQLIPMHTFFIGGDDRVFLTQISQKINKSNISVINKPMSLYEMYQIYSETKACIGMRYHSVVMQTILNGNNYILDYTNPKTGKIIGFLHELDNPKFYHNRYYNYTTGEEIDVGSVIKVLNTNEKYDYTDVDIISQYSELLKEHL